MDKDDRNFETKGRIFVDCDNCCWDLQVGILGSPGNFVKPMGKGGHLKLNAIVDDYDMPIDACGAPNSPKQTDGRYRICIKANEYYISRNMITERVA